MKKLKKLFLTAALALGVLALPTGTDAASYEVQAGDSFWEIANNYGVPVQALKRVNERTGNKISAGETLRLPQYISQADRELMARLVQAEAKGEPYAGKVAVATVILNRVDHKEFPNTVRGVVYERSPGGYYAFSPVENGEINKKANTEAKRAVNEAIAFRGNGQGSIYFYNPVKSTSKWIFSRTTTIVIGNHIFAK